MIQAPFTDVDVLSEIEQAYLGALLVSDEAYDVAGWMRPAYFYSEIHGRIFDSIQKLKESGKTATPQVVAQFFTQEAALEQVGGARYVYDLAQSVVSTIPTAVTSYAEHIYNAHTRRGMDFLGQQLQEHAAKATLDTHPRDLIAVAEKFISDAMDVPPDSQVRLSLIHI